MLFSRVLINFSLLVQGRVRVSEIPTKISNRFFNYCTLARRVKRRGFAINEIVFRPILSTDKLEYLDFINSYFRNNGTKTDKEIAMPECNEARSCYVALYKKKIVGKVEFAKNFSRFVTTWQIAGLSVLPDFRGFGIGEQIMRIGISAIEQDRVIMFLSVDKVNLRAIKLYKKLGFKMATEQERGKINNLKPPLHKIIMILDKTLAKEAK